MSVRKDENKLRANGSVEHIYGRKQRNDSSLTTSTAPFEPNLFTGKKHSASAKKIFETLEKNTRKRLSIQDFDKDFRVTPKMRTTKNGGNNPTRISLPD
jgi:hypothetical protein